MALMKLETYKELSKAVQAMPNGQSRSDAAAMLAAAMVHKEYRFDRAAFDKLVNT